jgi:hemin uptake protein HemP
MEKCLKNGVGKLPAKAGVKPCFHSRELFCGHREVCIKHADQQYRLYITRQNKLILTK